MVMLKPSVLNRKVIRELKENKGVYLACIMVIVIGLMVFSAMSVVLENLENAKERFYEDYHFAEGFVDVAGMPTSRVKALSAIAGIKEIEGQITKDVKVLTGNPSESVYLRLVSHSLLENKEKRQINHLYLDSGKLSQKGRREILVDPKFLEARKLKIGDSLNIVLEGTEISLTIIGTAQSPEFIYAMRKAQDLMPDPETFGIAYIPFAELEGLVRERGMVNHLVFTLSPGAEFNQVKTDLEEQLKPYGLLSIVSRDQQMSNMILSQEIEGLKAMVTSLPVVFLAVAAVILYTMLRRLVEQQRTSIGTLKAFGFSGREIVLHYLSYPVFIGLIGGLLGGFTGLALAFPLTTMYQQFFALPGLTSTWSMRYIVMSILFALVFSVLSGLKSSLDILKLNPSEAMRPPAPPSSRRIWIEKVNWFWKKLTVQSQMGIRNISRSKVRSLFTVVGISIVFSLMAISWAWKDMADLMMFYQFEKVQQYDIKIAFEKPLSAGAVQKILANEAGVTKVEPMLEAPAVIKKEWLKKEAAIIGLPQDSTLYLVIDDKERKVKIPEEGILMSKRLADLLEVKLGDSVYIESPFKKEILGEKTGGFVTVKGIIPQYVGINAFMEIGALQSFLEQGDISTSMMLAIEKESISILKEKYLEASEVAAIESTQDTIDKFTEIMGSYSYMTLILAFFGGITGFALIYNSSIIALSERELEIASLRVLGMTPREVLRVITSEQWFLSALGMVIGIPLTQALQTGMAQAVNSDLYSMPTSLPLTSYIWAAVGTAIAIIIAQSRAYARIKNLPFVDVLKTTE